MKRRKTSTGFVIVTEEGHVVAYVHTGREPNKPHGPREGWKVEFLGRSYTEPELASIVKAFDALEE